MQLGFVIDHSRCIGCHACTVACKSENDVPLGSFRTWVKYVEHGRFPEVRRSFAVLRCNQCSNAPCIEICPVHALSKRADGIVDIDPARCIGCKGCMQACPYDALYINETKGVAEKCHFCAHRTERGLAPACAVVCPTEAIIPGDFHDPSSRVSRMKATGRLVARRSEVGTGPNVYYAEVDPATIQPLESNAAGGYLWANQVPGIQLDAQQFEALERRAGARTVYDVHHTPRWGGRVSAYLFTKSLAAGAVLAAIPVLALHGGPGAARLAGWAGAASLLFLLLTTLLLVFDLKRPGRFLFILRYPNWRSWLARGAVVLAAFGGLTAAGILAWLLELRPAPGLLYAWTLLTALAAAGSASYTAWLFRQARGRALWLRRGLAVELLVHALLGGSALLLLVSSWSAFGETAQRLLRWMLGATLLIHLALVLLAPHLAPRQREEEYARAERLITRGPLARAHWILGLGLGVGLAALLLWLPLGPWATPAAAVAALVGLYVEQDALVRAGQALPIS